MAIEIKEILSEYLKIEKNVIAFKTLLNKVSSTDEELKRNLFEICYSLSNKKGVKTTYLKLVNNEFGKDADIFEEYKKIQEEQDEFITAPAEVEEGVLECGKCGGKRTISFSLQTRSSDEATSVWARCVQCGNRWRE